MKLSISIFALFASVLGFSQSFEEVVKSVASDRAEDDRLGYAVSIDGNYAAIGAYGDDFGGSNPNMGSVYIYEMQGKNNWVQVQKLFSSDQDDYDRFGWSVDMEGDFLVVGAYGEDDDVNDANSLSKAGSAYIFQNISGTWVETQKIVASDRDADDEFGWSVAIHDSTIVVGAHIEDHDAAGGDFKYHSGSVYMFELDGTGTWNETQKVVADDRWVDMNYPNGYSGEDLADQFGCAVDLWKDYMIVGAFHHDYATTSPLSGGLWTSGAAYIFERSGGVWTQVQKIQNSDREAWDRFGSEVAIDSNVIAVTAYSEDEDENGNNPLTNPGSVYLFERDLGGTWNEVQKIVPNDRSSGDHFGYSIDFEDTLMVLGCHSDDQDEFNADDKADAGSAYIFEKNGGIWSQIQKIDASDRAIGDDFGVDVGLTGHTIVVGAQYNDFNDVGADSLDDAGAAYFYSNDLCPILMSNNSPTICSGQSYTVGSSNYTSSGSYTDVVLSVAGCDSTVNTTLTVTPPITTSISPTICSGQSYTVGSDVFTTSGSYSTIITTTEGCDSVVNTVLTVEDEIIVDEYANMCDGGVYYINGTATYVPGNYSHTVQSTSGCDSTIITHLTMDAPITSDNYVSICYGDSYSIGLNTYTESGTYADVVSATNFCDSTIYTHLTVDLPPNLSISQNISKLTSNQNNATYQWIDCSTNEAIPGETNQSFFATEVGTYAVVVGLNACMDTSSCVHVSWIALDTENQQLEEAISIYPNPSNGQFTIALAAPSAEVKLFNSAGALVYREVMNNGQLQVSELAPGVYIAEIEVNGAVARKRVVVQ
ncbi:MAG: T9SS type A sorting domain-containing protein [Crocinitomicaceae bacterium]